jgi:hypothetical protein
MGTDRARAVTGVGRFGRFGRCLRALGVGVAVWLGVSVFRRRFE